MASTRSEDLQAVYIDYANDCQISLQRNWLKRSEADALYQELCKISWREETVVLFGKRHTLIRKTYSMADSTVGPYPYAGKLEIPEPFSENVHLIRTRLEADLGVRFNFALLNYYPDGDSSMGWHSDSENSIVVGSTIASLSLGATRRFDVRKRDATSGCAYKVDLGHGTLLLMEGKTQQFYKHQVPKQKAIKLPRINLTFRLMHEKAVESQK
jgi:alkylated DNA repair dioxygenase AlkB